MSHASAEPPVPGNRAALGLIFVIVFLDMFGASLLIPIVPYVVRKFQTDALTVGLLLVSYSAAQFASSPFLGALSDRFGRRPVLLLSVLGSSLAYFAFGMSTALWALFVSRIFDGLTGGNISTAQAYIADVTPPKDRAKNLGLIGAAFGLGFIAGPALGGVLAQYNLMLPAYFAGALALTSAVVGYFVLPESLPKEKRRRTSVADLNPIGQVTAALNRSELRSLLLAAFGLNFAISALQSNFSVFTLTRFGLGPGGNAVFFTMLGVISVVMQGVVLRRISHRFTERGMGSTGLVLLTLAFAGLAFVPAVWMLFPIMVLIGVGSSLANVSITGWISRSVSPLEQGKILGVTQAFISVTRIFGPVWAGWAFDHVAQGAPYLSGVFWLLGALMLLATFQEKVTVSRSPELRYTGD